MSETAREFLKSLDVEQRQFDSEMKLDSVGIMLLTAIKEFDFYYYNLIGVSGPNRRKSALSDLCLRRPW